TRLNPVSCSSRREVERNAHWRSALVVAATHRRKRANRKRRSKRTRGAGRPTWRGYLRALGPGLVTGASDDDPSGLATYSQAGATFGFGLLWAAPLTLPLAASVEEICDRTALATGKTLGQLARECFTRTWSILVGGLIALL